MECFIKKKVSDNLLISIFKFRSQHLQNPYYYNTYRNINNLDTHAHMNLFFSPSVHTYQVLAPHFQACQIVQALISTSSVQFELSPYDDPNDPFFHIHTRVKNLRNRVMKMLELIECKYHEEIGELGPEERRRTIWAMKEEMRSARVDHLKYLDGEEGWLEGKIGKFGELARNYDTFVGVRDRLEEELDTLRAKIQLSQKANILEQFVILTGVCQNTTISHLQKLIFRQSKGHSITVFKPRPNSPSTSIFLCLINKNIYKHIGTKISRSCQLNEVHLYELPNIVRHMHEYENVLIGKLRETEVVVEISGRELTGVIRDSVVGEGISLKQHLLRVNYLERLIYIICHSKHIGQPSNHVLFTFHIASSCPLPALPAAIFSLASSKLQPRTIMPRLPCLTEVNIMTQLFSTPKHNEIIPSIFMFTTVPVLFGMMFSDWGHGLLLLGVAVGLGLGPVFYLMAGMSVYCGVIYNQFFGMKVLRWGGLGIVQPIWAVAENGMNFQNSLKMKLAMVVAFFHMGFGMALKIVNQHKRGQTSKILYDSLPKILLLCTTVGYLVFLILTKWLTNYSGQQSTAPSIINSLLQLYLGWNPARKHSILGSIQLEKMVGTVLNWVNCGLVLVMVYDKTVRGRVQGILKGIFGGTGKLGRSGYKQLSRENQEGLDFQISEQLQMQNKQAQKSLSNAQQSHYHQPQHDHSSQLGPLQIFQFLLGLISSTTSYLRLFALSLAHAKLSSLMLDMLLSTLSGSHPYISLIRCIVFAIVTGGMMLILDVMECLMHVVRLHWVQWMGKFYGGCGRVFVPEVEGSYV